MSDDDDTRTADQVFGKTPPGKPVKPKEPSHLAGYRPRPKFRRRSDGRLYRIDDNDTQPETRLPDDYYSRD